ncbi:hypothetical protein BB560_004120 [Smittium megazygosporum]|uniref:Uncharacterized protein n=1 Tax=Smittium megazygosporum TaxID=133381 RepID=A0A2T9ZA32_9FUNG|nr:hypothetical protein BB560_004120 [Smittium megazygosporum]
MSDKSLESVQFGNRIHFSEFFVFSKSGILLDAIKADILSLLRMYQKESCYDFSSFKKIWRQLEFPMIHLAVPDPYFKHFFTLFLFRFVLENFNSDNSIHVNLAAVYTCYLLYFTQVESTSKEKIPLLVSEYELLAAFYSSCVSKGYDDPVYIIERLFESNAFELSAYPEKNPYILITNGYSEVEKSNNAALSRINKLHRLEHLEKILNGRSMGAFENLNFKKRHLELEETYSAAKKLLLADDQSTDEHNQASTRKNLAESKYIGASDFISLERSSFEASLESQANDYEEISTFYKTLNQFSSNKLLSVSEFIRPFDPFLQNNIAPSNQSLGGIYFGNNSKQKVLSNRLENTHNSQTNQQISSNTLSHKFSLQNNLSGSDNNNQDLSSKTQPLTKKPPQLHWDLKSKKYIPDHIKAILRKQTNLSKSQSLFKN